MAFATELDRKHFSQALRRSVSSPNMATVAALARALALTPQDSDGRRKPQYIFWLGAGASLSAGIPLATEMVNRLLDRLWSLGNPDSATGLRVKRLVDLSPEARQERVGTVRQWAMSQGLVSTTADSDWGAHYSKCLALLPGELDRQEFILDCVAEGSGRLNQAHLFLAQLMTTRFVRIALTTNFDDLLVRSLQLCFEYPAVVDQMSVRTLMPQSRFLQVAYLHGKLSSYKQRHTTADLRASIDGLKSFLTQVLNDHGLVVVGYRGGSEYPMEALLDVLRDRGAGPGRGLYWVTLETEHEALSPLVKEVLTLKDTYWIPAQRADEFFASLCTEPGLGLGLPASIREPRAFLDRVRRMLPDEVTLGWRDDQSATAQPGELPAEVSDSVSPEEASETERAKSQPVALGTFLAEALKLWRVQDWEGVAARSIAEIASDPSFVPGYVWLGAARFRQGKHLDAVAAARSAVEIDPASVGGLKQLGQALGVVGQHEEALQHLRRASELSPTDWEVYDLIGDELVRVDRYEEAIESYKTAAQCAPEKAIPLWDVARVHSILGRHEESIAWYRRALTLEPSEPHVLRGLASELGTLKRFDEAIACLVKADKFGPGNVHTLTQWAEALAAMGSFEQAADKFREAALADPKNADPWVSMSLALGVARPEEALEAIRRAQALDPNNQLVARIAMRLKLDKSETADPSRKNASRRISRGM